MANILHVCNSFDPAGDVTACFNELQKHSRHAHSIIVRDVHPLQGMYQFPQFPLVGKYTAEDIDTAQRWADAVIYHFVGPTSGFEFHNKPSAFRNVTAYYRAADDKFFATFDTTSLAKDLIKYNLIGANHLGAADFLSHFGDVIHFLPSLIPLSDPLYTPSWGDRLPCLSIIKNQEKYWLTYATPPAKQYLKGIGHRKVMNTRRTTASIVLDNVTDGHYGLAGLEAMSLGLPIIVYNHSKTIAQLRLISETPPVGMIEVGYNANIRETVLQHMDWSMTGRQLIRLWMESYYHSIKLIGRFWDPFCDKLLEAS